MIGSWATVVIVFLSGEVVVRYGALAGILLVLSFLAAFLCVLPFLKTTPLEETSSERIRFLYLGWFLESFFLHLLIGRLILEAMDIHPGLMAVFSIFLLAGCFFLFARWNRAGKLFLLVNGCLMFGLAILLPNYVFLQEGLETVYHNLQHYHPAMLHINQDGEGGFFLLLTFIFFCKLLLQVPLLRKYMGPAYREGVRKLFVSVLIFGTLILAFSTMTAVGITQHLDIAHPNALLLALMEEQTTSFIQFIFIGMLYLLTVLAMMIAYQEMREHVKPARTSCKMMLVKTAVLAMAGGGFLYFSSRTGLTVLQLYLWAGSGLSLLTCLFILPFYMNRIKVTIFKKV